MVAKRALIVGGLVAVLAVPAGAAVAATTAPSPATSGSSATQPLGPGAGYGPGLGLTAGGYGDPEDCPFYDSAQAQQWRDQRDARQQLSPAERQKLVQQHREQMWQLRTGGTVS